MLAAQALVPLIRAPEPGRDGWSSDFTLRCSLISALCCADGDSEEQQDRHRARGRRRDVHAAGVRADAHEQHAKHTAGLLHPAHRFGHQGARLDALMARRSAVAADHCVGFEIGFYLNGA